MHYPSGFFVAIILTFFTFSRQYEVGSLYSFNYEASVLLNEPQSRPVSTPKDVGFKIDLQVDLNPVWQNPSNPNDQVMKLIVRRPKLGVKARQSSSSGNDFVQKTSKAEELKDLPFFFHRLGGYVKNVYYSKEEPLSWLNIKKGIVSLFQYIPKDLIEYQTDTSGHCHVTYQMKGRQLLQKFKSDCERNQALFFNHTETVLSADISGQSETMFELDANDATIKSCSSIEIFILRPVAKKTSGVEIISKQVLHLKEKKASNSATYSQEKVSDVMKKISKQIRYSLVAGELTTTPGPKECIACKTLKELVNNFRKALKPSNLGTQSSAIAFLRLLGKIRDVDEKVIRAALKDKKNQSILPQLLDVVAAAQTVPAYKAAKVVLDFNGNIELPERYLLSLSLSTHPLDFIIEDLLKMSKKVKNAFLSETMVLTIAAMTKTYANQAASLNKKMISTVRTTLLSDLENCKDEACVLMYIRALQNLQSKSGVPVLLKYAKGSNKKQAIYAMRAIQMMPQDFIVPEIYKGLESILLELNAEHDSSVRAMAAEVLLRWKPKTSVIKNILKLLKHSSEKDKELHTLLLGHMQDLCEKNNEMEKLVRQVVKENKLANYNILSQGGLSSAFSRPLAKDNVVNASFTNMLEISGGILKRSNVDVFIDVNDSKMRLLSFGMFAGGLSMFGGGGEGNEEEEEANAGIEISLMGTQLRPFVFFNGQGELMGHVWSGTASERTTALQGSVLLQDHSKVVALQNGLNIEFLLTGVVSYDFAGQIQISLWNRNAHSLVEVGAAVVLQGQARVDNAFVQTMVEFNVGAQTQLNFLSDLEFSNDIMMCLRMMQPDFDVIENVRKFERIPGTNYVLRKYKRKSSTMPGKTYVMNRKNTEICNRMFK